MKNRYFVVSFIAIVSAVAILFSACRKINDATELGGGLIPPIDNITTFDTTLNVQVFNDTFGLSNDSLRVGPEQEQWMGRINNDPIFGRTDARMFFQLKPLAFPFAFKNRWDSLYIDSVVLVMDALEVYGDTNTVQTVNVYELDQSNNFKFDSVYLLRENRLTYSSLLGTKTFAPSILNDSIKVKGDTTKNQLRIRLSDAFGTRLLQYDTATYKNNPAFDAKFKGFAVQSMGSGNAVMGFNLLSANTKLAIYYRANNGGVNKFDTTQSYFYFSDSAASANYVSRDYVGTPVQASLGGTTSDAEIYMQNTPGTFATIKIPDLLNISNRTVHRAELIMEQKYDISDSTFRAPGGLYLDASDPSITGSNKYRTIPYDVVGSPNGPTNLESFGVGARFSYETGIPLRVWKFNITRYVQHVLTRTQSLYDLRLFSPYFIVESYGIPPGVDVPMPVVINSSTTKGRIRLHGSTGPGDPNTKRIRLRIVYSKL